MWRDDALLLDMLLAARNVREFTAGRTGDDFAADRMLQSATQSELQVKALVPPDSPSAEADV